jgi:hypothetical protein
MGVWAIRQTSAAGDKASKGKMMTAKTLLLILILAALGLMALPTGSGRAQLGGCADTLGLTYGARYRLEDLRGGTLTAAAIGIGDFDPAVTILDASGTPVACNEDSPEALDYGAGLPQVNAPANPRSAVASLPVPDAPTTYEVVVSSQNDRSGEFVLLIDGVEIFGASNVDRYFIFSNEGQVAEEVPLGVYAVNLDRPQQALAPTLVFRYGTEFTRRCLKSSAASLCQGEHEDLTGYSVTTGGERASLTGDDTMVYVEVGGFPATFEVEVASYQGRTFGPYSLLIYSGVGYPR